MAELKQYEDLAALVARLFMGAFFCVIRLFHADLHAGTAADMEGKAFQPRRYLRHSPSLSNSVEAC